MSDLLPDLLPSGLAGDKNVCLICGEPTLQRWCSWEHAAQGLAADAKVRPSATVQKKTKQDKRQTRRGDIYVAAKNLGFLDPTANGDIPFEVSWKAFQAAKPKDLSCSKDSYRRAINQRVAEVNMQVLLDDWELAADVRAMLGPDDDTMRALAAADRGAFRKQLKVMVKAYARFRDRFFETPRGETYITKRFHEKWIRDILEAIYLGKRHMILAPPRSGKTDLAISFGVWLIIRNPNIRILWVGASLDMATKAVDSMRSQLDDNEELRNAFLPPGVTWRPSGRLSGSTWSRNEFTVATRTIIGSKSPTVVGVGSGGKILSRDVDIIWLDDLEDHTTILQPGRRSDTRDWMDTTIESRKERESSLIMIGSRQHPDDLYSHIIDNKQWSHRIETAHAFECHIDSKDVDAHVDCMLFPERLNYEELIEKKEAMSSASFQMQFLNVATPTEGIIFHPEVVDACMNPNRLIGMSGVPQGCHLIAGIDPSPGSTQAAVLWAVDGKGQKVYLVDTSYGEYSHVDGARELMMLWKAKYHCHDFTIEAESWQKSLYHNAEMREWSHKSGVRVRPHQTQGKKWDPILGISGMVPYFERNIIDIPTKGTEASEKAKVLRKQLIGFVDETVASRSKNFPVDVVMAAWFPWKRITSVLKTEGGHGKPKLRLVSEASYPQYGSSESAMWGQTPYPGATAYPG